MNKSEDRVIECLLPSGRSEVQSTMAKRIKIKISTTVDYHETISQMVEMKEQAVDHRAIF